MSCRGFGASIYLCMEMCMYVYITGLTMIVKTSRQAGRQSMR
jgi:hypothetical protein